MHEVEMLESLLLTGVYEAESSRPTGLYMRPADKSAWSSRPQSTTTSIGDAVPAPGERLARSPSVRKRRPWPRPSR